MELTTSEDIHVLCLFEKYEDLQKLEEHISRTRLRVKNKPHIFGHQRILDENDEPVGEEEDLLIVSSGVSVQEVAALVKGFNGIAVPAHIDKQANSVIAVLGEFDYGLGFYPRRVRPRGRRAPAPHLRFRRALSLGYFRSGALHRGGHLLRPRGDGGTEENEFTRISSRNFFRADERNFREEGGNLPCAAAQNCAACWRRFLPSAARRVKAPWQTARYACRLPWRLASDEDEGYTLLVASVSIKTRMVSPHQALRASFPLGGKPCVVPCSERLLRSIQDPSTNARDDKDDFCFQRSFDLLRSLRMTGWVLFVISTSSSLAYAVSILPFGKMLTA